MTIEADFLELMTQTATREAFSAYNTYAEATYSAGVSVNCRVVNKPRMVRNAEGKDVISNAQVWCYGTPGFSVKDRLTLPDGTQPVIIQVGKFPDENGNHHEVVYV